MLQMKHFHRNHRSGSERDLRVGIPRRDTYNPALGIRLVK